MTNSAWALKMAIHESLVTDPTLVGLIGDPPRVYDHVPTEAALPYVVFGDWKVEENDTDDARIDAHTLMIEVWSSYAGLKEAKTIAAVIETALHGAALTLEDNTLIDLSFIAAAFLQDTKAQVSQAVLRMRALTQAT